MRRWAAAGSVLVGSVVWISQVASASAGWERVQSGTGQDAPVFDIAAADALHAVAVGVQDSGGGNSQATVWITMSGGSTWMVQRPSSGGGGPFAFEMYTSVETMTADRVLVGAMGKLFISDNGGLEWRFYKETGWTNLGGPIINAVRKTDASTAYLVGTNGLMRKTTDAGDTWSEIPNPVAGLDWTGIAALGPNVWVWAGRAVENEAGEVTGYADGALARSGDGGATWTVHFQGEPRVIRRVSMLNNREGWMISRSMEGNRFERTTDGGRSWIPITNIPSGPGGPPDELLDVRFFDRCEGFLLAERAETFSQLFYTRDAGANWTFATIDLAIPTPLPIPVRSRLVSLSFLDRNLGYAGGTYEAIYRYVSDEPGPSCGGEPGDGGVPTGGDGGGGCECRAASPSAGPPGWLGLIPIAVLLHRRRR
jgi:MYXO-CTERM domain-containing protein